MERDCRGRAQMKMVMLALLLMGLLVGGCASAPDQMTDACHGGMKKLCEDPRFSESRQCRESCQ